MSYFYKHNFVSSNPLIARIKEELRSYFDTNMVDDTLFPKYIDYCLSKLGKSTYQINQTLLNVKEFKATLPEDLRLLAR